eukprot:TRINITY_DN7502_c0_g1_i1.p1 TRINITY_DN7502_c0_g1~~TRINITY_DN7502_c0_g1_i1.p1  ORF type:complete len:496 (-),score=92.75 TRINITY_DN7502_c0_g1_i1:145-1632(-)
MPPTGSLRGSRGKSKGKGKNEGKGQGPGQPKKPTNLDTVFGAESFESIQSLKADGRKPLSRVLGSFEAGESRKLLVYTAPVEGTDQPVIEIPLRPVWTAEEEADNLTLQEAEYFNAWLSDVLRYPIEELNYFEHNLEVWRQVWRMAFELADIVMMVVDSRIPLFHFSQAVFTHLHDKLKKDVVLVLSKADLVPGASIKLWQDYFSRHCQDVKVVPFRVPKSGSGRIEQLPCVTELLDALKSCSVLRGGKRISAHSFFEGEREVNPAATRERSPEEFIKVALQGDPNVGKSSIINAIFGRKLVSSSTTPGHTKHFKTCFFSRGVAFLDYPGIVCPKLGVPKPLQTLFGSYRIAQVREPFHIIRFLAERCWPPLPELLKITASKDQDSSQNEPWSPIGICEAFARKIGFMRKGTNKVDPYRAAYHILKTALNGSDGLALCFAPPGVDPEMVRAAVAAAREAGDDEKGQLDDSRASSGEEAQEEKYDDGILVPEKTWM